MYEVVKVVKGYEITRMKGTRGFYTVTTCSGKNWSKCYTFRTIKAAAEFIEQFL